MAVYAACFLNGKQIFVGHLFNQRLINLEWLVNAGNDQAACVFEVVAGEGCNRLLVGRAAYVVSDIDCKEIGRIRKLVHVVHVNVVGINEIGLTVTQCVDGVVGLNAGVLGIGVYYLMFAVGLVPDGNEMYSVFGLSFDQRGELCLAFVREPVTYAERVFS